MLFNLFAQSANAAGCPFGHDQPQQIPSGQNPTINGRFAPEGYYEAFKEVSKNDFAAVRKELKALFMDSRAFWPADYNHYGPLLIRLAWHSAGSYRVRDGRGGVDGGRMRFEPERSWADNTNLDKARAILAPIKKQFGVGLSWGDLIVLAGDTAIQDMGGEIVGFCGGRIDDNTGFWSERLGPNAHQEDVEPCDHNSPDGLCEFQAAFEPGAVYVNPEGPFINGTRHRVPNLSARNVRETFRRMGMNDTETVALVGGGHAFGKTHSACPAGPGLPPNQAPESPWVGGCGTGVGVDTATSAWEGPWTTNPMQWDNEYFHNILDYEWELTPSPAGNGHMQWQIKDETVRRSMRAPNVDGMGKQNIMMTTADLALTAPMYKNISMEFRNNEDYLTEQFAEAWYKLMTRDMGPVTRCLNEDHPEPRDFQNPLPAPPAKLADFTQVKEMIRTMLTGGTPDGVWVTVGADTFNGQTNYGPLFVRLAWRCAATHRVTDYTGGCDGARIRLAPQRDWKINEGLNEALDILEPIKNKFGDSLSWADLIVLAGTTSLEEAGAPEMPFCGGRTDAAIEGNAGVMPPRLNEDIDNSLDALRETALLMGLSPREFTALQGRRSLGRHDPDRGGFQGTSSATPLVLDNDYYKALLHHDWNVFTVPQTGRKQYQSERGDLKMLRSDLLLTFEPEFLAAAQDFASDNDMFLNEFAGAWTKIMNADRYDGPTGNLCKPFNAVKSSDCPLSETLNNENTLILAVVVLAVLLLFTCVINFVRCCLGGGSNDPSVVTGNKGSISMPQRQQSPRGAGNV